MLAEREQRRWVVFAGKQTLTGMPGAIELQSECLHPCCAREMLLKLFKGTMSCLLQGLGAGALSYSHYVTFSQWK